MTTIPDAMLIDRIDREAVSAGLKALQLRLDDRGAQALLLDRAERFWLNLGNKVALGRPLTRDEAFVTNYLTKDMSDDPRLWNRPTRRGKRTAAVS